MPIPASLKQTPNKDPSLATLIQPLISSLLAKIAIAKLLINIIKNEPPNVAGIPLFIFGSFTSNFKSLIHRFEKKYRRIPQGS